MRVLLDECVSEGLRNYLPGHQCHFSTVFAGQAVGIKEVDDGIWLVSFMDYDLGISILRRRLCSP